MSALQHIRDYLAIHMAGYDIETLMTHFETAVEAKVEEAVAEVRQEIADLRDELIPPATPAKPDPVIEAKPDPAPELAAAPPSDPALTASESSEESAA